MGVGKGRTTQRLADPWVQQPVYISRKIDRVDGDARETRDSKESEGGKGMSK